MDDIVHDSLEAYTIGALDRAERTAFERHLEACEACRQGRDSYRDVLSAMSELEITPPPVPRIASTLPVRAVPSKRGVAFALAVAASLAIVTTVAVPRYERAAQVEHAYAEIARMLATDPIEVALVGSRGVTGRAIVGDGRRKSGFIVRGLPDARPGFVYRVWLRGASSRREAGVLERTPDGLHVLVTPGNAFVHASSIHVMLEPAIATKDSIRSLVLSGTIG
ncbi:MAG: anti-sigma factor [Vulcanimicrobiaceae bacterium]